MLVDSHCHLTDEKLRGKLKNVLKGMGVEGVERVMVVGGNVEDSGRVVDLVKRFDQIDGVVGIHPEMIGKGSFNVEAEMEKLEELVKKERSFVKGIGEIGLDFYYDKEKKSKAKQLGLFEAQLKLAVRENLPVVIHMREAEEEMGVVLKNFEGLRGVFHCWSGSEDFLRFVLEQGFYISVAGNVTFKSADELRRLVVLVPKERLLLETDSPYLSPEPARGRLNEPKNVKILATFVAGLRKVKTQDLIKQTGKNYLCLFG